MFTDSLKIQVGTHMLYYNNNMDPAMQWSHLSLFIRGQVDTQGSIPQTTWAVASHKPSTHTTAGLRFTSFAIRSTHANNFSFMHEMQVLWRNQQGNLCLRNQNTLRSWRKLKFPICFFLSMPSVHFLFFNLQQFLHSQLDAFPSYPAATADAQQPSVSESEALFHSSVSGPACVSAMAKRAQVQIWYKGEKKSPR